MANTEIVTSHGKKIKYYGLDAGVGIDNMPNKPDDVAIVQYLLVGYFRKAKVKPIGTMAVDGVFGAKTHYWSLFFSMLMLSEGHDILTEAGDFWPTNGNMYGSAIWYLNLSYRKVNPNAPADLQDDPGFPPMLRGKIK